MKITISLSLQILLISVFFTSCIDPISFDISSSPKLLVVDGNFTDFPGNHSLRLWQTSEFSRADTPLSNANISIFDDEGNEAQYFNMGEGQYILAASSFTRGESGKSYFIEIRLEDGKTYRSQPEVMPQLIEADSAYFQIEGETFLNEETGIAIERNVLNLYVDTPIPPNSKSYLRWLVEDTWSFTTYPFNPPNSLPIGIRICYFTDGIVDPQDIITFSNVDLNIDRLTRQKVGTRSPLTNFKYESLHYFNVYQQSLTQEAHEYFENLNQVANLQGSIFDPVPGAVRGNISNIEDPNEEVLGYFYVAAVDTAWEATRFNDLRALNISSYCPRSSRFSMYIPTDPIECLLCNFEGQTPIFTGRPYYWGFE